MTDEALSGPGTQRSPEPGWYPDPVGRAAHRYWNGTEWTANTRGAAASSPPRVTGSPGVQPETESQARAIPVSRPTPVEAAPTSSSASFSPSSSPSSAGPALVTDKPAHVESPASASKPLEPDTKAQSRADSAGSAVPEPERSLFGLSPETASTQAETATGQTVASSERMSPSVPQRSETPTSSDRTSAAVSVPVSDGGSRRLAFLLGALLIASAAFAGGLAVQRFVLDGQASPDATTPTNQVTTTATTASTPTNDDQVAQLAAQLEALEAELAGVVAERDAALAAAAAGGDTAALQAQVANLETHVDTMRSWFTTAILDAADAAFDAEVSRACAADAEPTLDNTSYTNRMEPAGTHADIVAAALVCRAEGG